MGRLGGPTAARLGYWVGSVARLAGRLGSAMAGRLAWLDLADWIGSASCAPRQAAAHFFFLFSFLLLFTSFSLTKWARRAALLLLLSLACGSRSMARSSSGEWLSRLGQAAPTRRGQAWRQVEGRAGALVCQAAAERRRRGSRPGRTGCGACACAQETTAQLGGVVTRKQEGLRMART